MEVKRGDVVVIVGTDEIGRPRPAVVVQANELGGDTTAVLICPITSDLTARLSVRPSIGPRAENGLHAPSQIMTDRLVALRRDRIRRVIGAIDPDTQEQLDQALAVLALAR
jgi:mRNA interferase MazF